MRQHSFTVLPCLNKNQADINCSHLSVRNFCDNCAAIEAVWLAPINENAVKLAKKSKREAVWVRFPSGKLSCHSFIRGAPKSIAQQTFWGRRQTNEATLKENARIFFLLRSLFGGGEAISFARRANFIATHRVA